MWFSAGWFFPIPPLNSGAGQPFAVAAWCPRDFRSSNRIDSSDLRNWRLWRLWEVDNFSLISPRTPPTLARVSQADGEAKVHAQTLCSSQKVFCSLFFLAYPSILSRLSLGQWCTDRVFPVFRDSLRFDFGCFDFSLPKLSQQTKHHRFNRTMGATKQYESRWRVDASCRNSIFRVYR